MATFTLVWIFQAGLLITASDGAAEAGSNGPTHFAAQIAPFLQTHCVACHSGGEPEGGIRFDKYGDSPNVQTDYELWEKAARLIRENQMPPLDEVRPTTDEVVAITAAINTVCGPSLPASNHW